MQVLRKGFGEAIRERLHHNRRVVVIGAPEALRDLVFAHSGRHDEATQVVGDAARPWCDEIGQRHIGAALATGELLAKRVQRRDRLVARLVGVDLDIVALGIGGPEADDAAGRKPVFADDAVEHRRSIIEQRPRGSPVFVVVEDRRIFAGQLPGREERRPVDIRHEVGQRKIPQRPPQSSLRALARAAMSLMRRFCSSPRA